MMGIERVMAFAEWANGQCRLVQKVEVENLSQRTHSHLLRFREEHLLSIVVGSILDLVGLVEM